MEIIFYIIIFLIGILFGSFYTLAVYRIPKGQDITHTHSYCPKCEHKLGFLDLIPVFSYIFLGGKCRYCKEKIRPRYFIIEVISGIFFVMVAYLMGLSIYNLNLTTVIDYIFIVLYFTFIILMAGIDKENRKINQSVIMYGVIISIMYIVYLCIIDKTSIYRYGIYLLLFLIVLILDTITLKRKAINRYVYSIILTLITMTVFSGEYVTLVSMITILLATAIYILIMKVKNRNNKSTKNDKQISDNISMGFCLAIPNIIFLISVLAYCKFLN